MQSDKTNVFVANAYHFSISQKKLQKLGFTFNFENPVEIYLLHHISQEC